jgi:hypothetical protein
MGLLLAKAAIAVLGIGLYTGHIEVQPYIPEKTECTIYQDTWVNTRTREVMSDPQVQCRYTPAQTMLKYNPNPKK